MKTMLVLFILLAAIRAAPNSDKRDIDGQNQHMPLFSRLQCMELVARCNKQKQPDFDASDFQPTCSERRLVKRKPQNQQCEQPEKENVDKEFLEEMFEREQDRRKHCQRSQERIPPETYFTKIVMPWKNVMANFMADYSSFTLISSVLLVLAVFLDIFFRLTRKKSRVEIEESILEIFKTEKQRYCKKKKFTPKISTPGINTVHQNITRSADQTPNCQNTSTQSFSNGNPNFSSNLLNPNSIFSNTLTCQISSSHSQILPPASKQKSKKLASKSEEPSMKKSKDVLKENTGLLNRTKSASILRSKNLRADKREIDKAKNTTPPTNIDKLVYLSPKSLRSPKFVVLNNFMSSYKTAEKDEIKRKTDKNAIKMVENQAKKQAKHDSESESAGEITDEDNMPPKIAPPKISPPKKPRSNCTLNKKLRDNLSKFSYKESISRKKYSSALKKSENEGENEDELSWPPLKKVRGVYFCSLNLEEEMSNLKDDFVIKRAHRQLRA